MPRWRRQFVVALAAVLAGFEAYNFSDFCPSLGTRIPDRAHIAGSLRAQRNDVVSEIDLRSDAAAARFYESNPGCCETSRLQSPFSPIFLNRLAGFSLIEIRTVVQTGYGNGLDNYRLRHVLVDKCAARAGMWSISINRATVGGHH